MLEAFLKTYSLGLKKSVPELVSRSLRGVFVIMKAHELKKMSFLHPQIVRYAHRILSKHWDPFDAFIFATANALGATLLTEDRDAHMFYDRVINFDKSRILI